ncbi:hypothetical protein [uncultured Roseivirga sp.]|uniref:hypothetical protein n=1 Tax=uncultured Roseivirga sp. TaxID=543088 RepID=UPI0030DCCDE0
MEKPYNDIIVIPGEGCGGCISSATYFVTENYESLRDVAIVFTGVQDTKLLKNQIGDEFLNKENVFIDSNNFLMKREVRSSYPYTLKMSSSRVTDFTLFEEAYFLNSK